MISVDEILTQWAQERPDLDVSPMNVIGRLARAGAIVDSALALDYAQWSLDPGSFDLLFTLARSGPPYALSPTGLTDSSMVSSAAVAQRLNRLVAAGLVVRAQDPNDGRGTVVTLTPAGKELASRALPSHLHAEERLLSRLDEAERAQLASLLQRIIR